MELWEVRLVLRVVSVRLFAIPGFGLFEEPLEALPSALCLPFSLLLAVVILCLLRFGT